ncbi:nitroreductase [Phaeobacter marinintestinus]|uniref:nitroreductase n=1 Tax=Falsiphaeobacter marinintestinus TaxID=1492905 RepID=UPI0011B48A1A|nr:nitroreductase [Phaeobacter marinintestinus]
MTVSLSELDDLFVQRHSCRGFKTDQVPQETIEQIVNTARRVPSWCNAQPWQITVTSGAETDKFRAELMKMATESSAGLGAGSDLPFPTSYSGVYQSRRRSCGWALYRAVGVGKGDRGASAREMMKNFELFGAPHVAIVTSPTELGAYGAMDCGGFVAAFTLAATAAGVATVPQAALATFAPFLHEYFDIPEDRMILCGISFGYADPDHPANSFRTTRAEVDDIIDWRS